MRAGREAFYWARHPLLNKAELDDDRRERWLGR
jgi:hypothetical protein